MGHGFGVRAGIMAWCLGGGIMGIALELGHVITPQGHGELAFASHNQVHLRKKKKSRHYLARCCNPVRSGVHPRH